MPIPGWLFLWGAGVVLVLSFLALGVLWKRPQLDRRAVGRPLPPAVERVIRSRVLEIALGALSAGLLVLVFLTALIGEPVYDRNLSPWFVLIVFWLGLVPVQVLFGNLWSVLNPWLAVANGFAWIWRRLGREWVPPLVYPERLGVWPAALALYAFAALELAYIDPGRPRALALAIAIYSYAMWFGMAAFGRRWDEHANGFTVYFGLFARIAPFGAHEGRLVRRTPFSGLAGAERTPGMLGFLAMMLGSVLFDSVSNLASWQDLRAELQRPYVLDAPGTAELIGTGLALAGIALCAVIVAATYLGAVAIARRLVGERELHPEFLLGLVPIALAYAVAHYFTALVRDVQTAWARASDPFGYGWNLFGSADHVPPDAPIAPNTVWYTQFAVLVVGHVAGLAIAHDRAVTLLPERDALRSQYAMLALMVLYTIGGLWLLSQLTRG